MNRLQVILAKIAEKCNEVAQRALKAQKFGIFEIQEGQDKDNLVRLLDEFMDLAACMNLLNKQLGEDVFKDAFESILNNENEQVELNKREERFEKYLKLGVEKGMINKDAIK